MDIITPEERIACADQLFTLMVEKSGDGVLIVQPDASIVYANEQAARLLGFSVRGLLNTSYSSLFGNAHAATDLNRFHLFFTEQKEFERNETELMAKDGDLVLVETSTFSSVCRGSSAQMIVLRDIRRHRQIDLELEKNSNRYRDLASIVDRSFEAIMITDIQGIIQYVNISWERLNGWSAEEIVGKVTPRIIKSGMQSAVFYDEFWKALLEGSTVERVLINKRKDGTLYEAEIIAMPLKDDRGVITQFAGFQHDVTARNQARAQLIQEKEFSEDIIERVDAIVIVVDMQGVITRFNEKAEQSTGYVKEEMVGKSLFETVFPREKYPLLWSEFNYARGEEGMTKNFENSITTKKGEDRTIAWTVSEMRKNGNPVALIAFGTDITERKKMEADMAEKNDDLERFKNLMVGRELRMIELKQEIASLKQSTISHDNEADIDKK